jgi:hypothetical protein
MEGVRRPEDTGGEEASRARGGAVAPDLRSGRVGERCYVDLIQES